MYIYTYIYIYSNFEFTKEGKKGRSQWNPGRLRKRFVDASTKLHVFSGLKFCYSSLRDYESLVRGRGAFVRSRSSCCGRPVV